MTPRSNEDFGPSLKRYGRSNKSSQFLTPKTKKINFFSQINFPLLIEPTLVTRIPRYLSACCHGLNNNRHVSTERYMATIEIGSVLQRKPLIAYHYGQITLIILSEKNSAIDLAMFVRKIRFQ